jgi:hypothetical protein
MLRICGILCLAAATSLFAQHGRGGGGRAGGNRAGMRGAGPGPRANAQGAARGGPNALDRWNRMSPEQRQRALEKLPPERRKQLEDRLERWNQLPKEQQERLRERYERFSSLPADKQQLVRQQYNRFRQLPPERQQELNREYAQLRDLPGPQRQERLNSDEFRSRFSPEDQQILRDLSENLGRK